MGLVILRWVNGKRFFVLLNRESDRALVILHWVNGKRFCVLLNKEVDRALVILLGEWETVLCAIE